ncbi:MAG: hypothetical protein PHO56_03955 [Patescibacteria group bacterium]|nr:hypothetical protein [Patescibacteria group bacterium]
MRADLIFVLMVFVGMFFSSANGDEKKYRHGDDPDFSAAMLTGPIRSDEVSKFRGDFYSRNDFELAKKQKENPGKGIAEEIAEQFENRIDFALGVDFPAEKREIIGTSLKKMHLKLEPLRKALENGKLDKDYYLSVAEYESEEFLNACSKVLSEQEFEDLFQFKKIEIKGTFKRVLKTSSQE